jgi:transcriptional regulator with XRE-family HTH domain
MTTWNDRLESARIARGISPADLARAVGISAPTMSDWRAGKIRSLNAEHAYKLCKTLHVRMAWLLFGHGAMEDHRVREEPPAYRNDPTHRELIALFDRLTASQQADILRAMAETQRQNDILLAELLARTPPI